MLSEAALEAILSRLPRLRITVVGDLFLDRYFDLDATLTERSLETGLEAYQAVCIRAYPGAAGTVVNNLAALGVGTIVPVAVIGDDGEGYELRQALSRLPAVRQDHLFQRGDRRTPTYSKPMLHEPGKLPRELNRIDIKNRHPLPADAEEAILQAILQLWPASDAMVVVDQVSEANCGVVTERVRTTLSQLGAHQPDKCLLADSRHRIGWFANLWLKPNLAECRAAIGAELEASLATAKLAERCGRPVFCTCGADGIWLARPGTPPRLMPARPVAGPIDPVGAGDSVNAGLAGALAAGADLETAATFANLVASITIQQIGVTGVATPQQLRALCRAAVEASADGAAP
ncbi:MAG: PfkB family carbohydrate kinase [Gemmataceae bacterium]|nr:PfkB family carbohydrate kinase [Gemmataceae bacterium]